MNIPGLLVKNTESCDEALIVPVHENVRRESLRRTIKKARELGDVPREERKREASEPLYLVRYE